jgi:hypothetical protein
MSLSHFAALQDKTSLFGHTHDNNHINYGNNGNSSSNDNNNGSGSNSRSGGVVPMSQTAAAVAAASSASAKANKMGALYEENQSPVYKTFFGGKTKQAPFTHSFSTSNGNDDRTSSDSSSTALPLSAPEREKEIRETRDMRNSMNHSVTAVAKLMFGNIQVGDYDEQDVNSPEAQLKKLEEEQAKVQKEMLNTTKQFASMHKGLQVHDSKRSFNTAAH